MRVPDWDRLDATAIAVRIRAREFSAVEALEAAIERADARDPAIAAIVRRRDEAARLEAAAWDARLAAGDPGAHATPFAGVPMLVKDLLSTLAGAPCGAGTRVLQSVPMPADAELVARLRRAGLVIFGQTATPELGLTPYTEPRTGAPTRNPWDPARSPGGSSGGSAAAVAARIVPMAGGGDGGGSIRIPASCCGLFGLKPSRGLVPTGPLHGELWRGWVVEHALTRSVRDSAALLDAVAGADPGAPYAAPREPGRYVDRLDADPPPMRIAFTARALFGDPDAPVHAECVAGLRASAALLASLGHRVEEAAPEVDAVACARDFTVVLAGECAAELRTIEALTGRRVGPRDLEPQTWALALIGRSLSAEAYAAAAARLQLVARRVGAFFERHDALLTPTLARPPVRIGELQPPAHERAGALLFGALRSGGLLRAAGALEMAARRNFAYIPFTPLFNVTGQPAMSVPLHWSADGLPVGMQLAGRLGEDGTLLALAAQLERAVRWDERVPPSVAAPAGTPVAA